MKKLFTFLMLAALVTMGFAQVRSLPVQNIDHYFGNVGIDRSTWYGNTAFEGFCGGMTTNNAFYLVINAGDIPTGATLEKVCFGHYYNGTSCKNRNYSIHLYRNPTIDEENHSMDPGTEISTWDYEAQAGNAAEVVQVDFPSSYTVVENEALCIGIVFGGANGALCLGQYDGAMSDQYYLNAGDGISQYVFGPQGSEERYPTPYVLAVYYNDGQPYVNQVDITPALLDPEDEETSYITSLAVDPEGDAFYCKIGVFNEGMDMFKGDVLFDAYITCEGATEPAYFYQNDTLLAMDSIESGRGYVWQPFALFTFEGADDPDYTSWAELQAAGFSLPFEFCVKLTPVIAPDYSAEDVNLENNTQCITVTDVHDGIIENNNTLTVSPNPASTYLNVENAAGAQISVYNIAGQEVLSVESAEANETLNISSLNAGLYIVRVANGNEVSTAKVSIVR